MKFTISIKLIISFAGFTYCLPDVHLSTSNRTGDPSVNTAINSALYSASSSTHPGAISFLLPDDSIGTRLDPSSLTDRIISGVLGRDGPDMRPSRGYKDFEEVDEGVAVRAWTLLREHTTRIAKDQVRVLRPKIGEILSAAKVSDQCQHSAHQVLDGLERLDSWAFKLANSWGNFPAIGVFEGTYSDVGSFDSCYNAQENRFINHSHYCSLTFKPFLPKRRDYDLVINKEPKSIVELFARDKVPRPNSTELNDVTSRLYPVARDAFEDLIEHAQYNHFVYYKLGTCWPIGCSPVDVKLVAKLLGKRNLLINGPVKCYSRFKRDYAEEYPLVDAPTDNPDRTLDQRVGFKSTNVSTRKLAISIWDQNDGIYIWKPHFNTAQRWAMTIIILVSAFILLMTSIDLVVNRLPKLYSMYNFAMLGLPIDELTSMDSGAELGRPPVISLEDRTNNGDRSNIGRDKVMTKSYVPQEETSRTTFMNVVDDCSIITNAAQFFRVSESQMRNDILSLNGIRCITMVWIIMTHTMLYNDWSAFGRTRQIEEALKSPLSQPFFNGSYLVDTFFLMSGLLSAFTTFRHCSGLAKNFKSIAFILSRWLRLTPQILFASLIYIVLPAFSWGPHWWPVVGEYSENCVQNWWINVLHMQAFYKTDRMCNFVTWWISIDFFYQFFALAIIWIILLSGHKFGFISIVALVTSQVAWQSIRHYRLSLPPNIFSTIPQTGSMWTEMTLNFYWKPYAHAVPFAFGFYIGYLMALKRKLILKHMNPRRAMIGWFLASSFLLGQSYASYWWVTGECQYTRIASTVFHTICPIIWAASLCWTIIACHHGYGGFINQFLSCKVFVILGKASYFVYLSHFQILFIFYGNRSLLLEPSTLFMGYVILGNIFMSTLLGIFLCVVYELPWLKQQRKLMKFA